MLQKGKFQSDRLGSAVSYTENIVMETGTLEGVRIFELRDNKSMRLITAEYGRRVENSLGDEYFVLSNGAVYDGLLSAGDQQVATFGAFAQKIESYGAAEKRQLKVDALPTVLLQKSDDAHHLAALHWRYSLPVVALVVSLIALAMSKTNHRSGRYVKMLPAILIYLLYLLLITGARSLIEGGGFLARHCLGFAYAEQLNWTAATAAFVESAQAAEVAQDKRIAKFWAQAGNAALAGGDAQKALEYLNAALVQGSLKGLNKGLVHLDRARAHVALENYPSAKSEFAMVHELAPQDPLGWLLSATLARRMGDLELAKNDIVVADQTAPGDPAIALEAGNISFEAGDRVNAKANWEKAVKINADSRSAIVAQKYLDQLVAKVEE